MVVGELYHSETEVRTLAAEVLGKASQNNPRVQKQVVDNHIFFRIQVLNGLVSY